MDSNLQNQIPFSTKLFNAITNVLGYLLGPEHTIFTQTFDKISKKGYIPVPQHKTFMEKLVSTPSSERKISALIVGIFLALIFIIILFDKIRIYFF